MGQVFTGYGIRRVTREPGRDCRHEDGTTFRPQVDRWYLMGDNDDGLFFLGAKEGYPGPEYAGFALWERNGTAEPESLAEAGRNMAGMVPPGPPFA